MIHFINEDTNVNITKHIPWKLPDGIKNMLLRIKENNKDEDLGGNHDTKEAWDHLNDILKMDAEGGINVKEMKRIKHWFDKHTNATTTKQYELYGGDAMATWVNNQLTSARRTEQQRKEAERAAGKTNAFKKEHTAERSTTVTKVDNSTPTYNPMTGNKQKRLKELSALKENKKTVILTEEQRNQIQEYLLKNK